MSAPATVIPFPTAIDAAPWERQPHETAKAYCAFVTYRDMGDERSLVKVGQTLGKKRQLLERWSKRFGWVDRVRAWDGHEQRRIDEERWLVRRKAIRDAEQRHIEIAKAFQAEIIKNLQAMQASPAGLHLSPKDMKDWFDVAVKIERLALGEETERVATEHSGSVGGGPTDDVAGRLLSNLHAQRLAHELLSSIAFGNTGDAPNVAQSVAESDGVNAHHGQDAVEPYV